MPDSLPTPELSMIPPTDPVKELRLRAWARANFVPLAERLKSWHPVVLDEMARRDAETIMRTPSQLLPMGGGFVPLAPVDVLVVNPTPIVHAAHLRMAEPHLTRREEYVIQREEVVSHAEPSQGG